MVTERGKTFILTWKNFYFEKLQMCFYSFWMFNVTNMEKNLEVCVHTGVFFM